MLSNATAAGVAVAPSIAVQDLDIALPETPRWAKNIPYTPGLVSDYGGITDSVELIVAPVVRIEDVFVRADPRTGRIRVQANLRNAAKEAVPGRLEFAVPLPPMEGP